jgi:hypothetical protein
MSISKSTVLKVDGMNGPNTRRQVSLVQEYLGVDNKIDIFDPSGITRIHWHWTVSGYSVTPQTVKHYNGVFDCEGNEYDGGSPPQHQANYGYNMGVSHTLNANTGSVGLAVACLAGVKPDWGSMTVKQGKYPITWNSLDSMLEKTMELCKLYNIYPSPWTTLTHAEIQPNLGIRQRGKWDIQILPDEPTKIISAIDAGNKLRKRMLDNF